MALRFALYGVYWFIMSNFIDVSNLSEPGWWIVLVIGWFVVPPIERAIINAHEST